MNITVVAVSLRPPQEKIKPPMFGGEDGAGNRAHDARPSMQDIVLWGTVLQDWLERSKHCHHIEPINKTVTQGS